MTQQDASTSDAEAVNHIEPKPVKIKGQNGLDQDQSTPAKKPRHSEIKKHNRKWKCATCRVGFSFWTELNLHVRRAHEETNEKTRVNTKAECGICKKSYSTNGYLLRHVRTAHPVDLHEAVPDVKEKTVNITEKENLSHREGKVPSILTPSKVADTTDITVLIKENITKHVKNKHNLVGKLKISLILYQCMYCGRTEDTFDAAVYHAQVHLVQTKENGTQCKQACRHVEQGCVLLYQCGACKLIIEPGTVQKHCRNNRACVEGGQGYKCKKCQISFYTSKALRRHKRRHENNQPLMVQIATFNNKDDVHFNNILKQISSSSVDDTHEDTELEEISRNPGTPENDGLEKNVDVQVPKYCVQSFDYEAHNDYHETKTNRTMETILGQIQPRNVAKGIVGKKYQNDQSAFKRRRICGEDNNPGGMLKADNKSQSTKDQQALEEDVESVHSRHNKKQNENFDQRNRELQEDTRTAANNGAVKKIVSGETGALESSEFVSLNGNMAILHGSFNQEDLRFNSSRGKQCTGIAAVACAAFYVLDPNTWTKSIINRIVTIGDKYYNDCIANRAPPAAGEVNPEYLAVSDLMPTIFFSNLSVHIAFDEDTNLNGHIDNDDSSKGFPNLMNALKLFFRTHASGILTSNAMSVAVYCKPGEETYWLFDSHSRGPEGVRATGGAACCMRFSHLHDLHALLRRNLFQSPSDGPMGNVFSLTSLSI